MLRRIRLEPHLTDDQAAVTGYSAYWIGQIARRYNRDGPDGVRDRRHRAGEPRLILPEGSEERCATRWPAPIPTVIGGAGAPWPPGSASASGAG